MMSIPLEGVEVVNDRWVVAYRVGDDDLYLDFEVHQIEAETVEIARDQIIDRRLEEQYDAPFSGTLRRNGDMDVRTGCYFMTRIYGPTMLRGATEALHHVYSVASRKLKTLFHERGSPRVFFEQQ